MPSLGSTSTAEPISGGSKTVRLRISSRSPSARAVGVGSRRSWVGLFVKNVRYWCLTGDAWMSDPIVVEYDPVWPRKFADLADVLAPVLGDLARGIHHVGSTAIPGMSAKPILDIDIELEFA